MSARSVGRVPTWTVEHNGEEWIAEIAIVERFHLGVEDHGLFVAEIGFTGNEGGWGQHISPHALDDFDEETRERVGTAFGCDYIINVVRLIGSPEQAAGRRVVVFRRTTFGLIEGFTFLNADGSYGAPFFPKELAARHFPADVR